MKRNVLILIGLVLVGLISCEKDSSQAKVMDTREKHLIEFREINGMTTTITTFSYDDKKRLSAIRKGKELTTYTYTGNQLTSIDVNDGDVHNYSEITYKNNYPATGTTSMYIADVLKRKLNYEYFSTLSRTEQINISETGSSTKRHYYEYENANIISQIAISNRVFTNYELEYGDKKNVFFNASIRWPLAMEKFDRVSTNEILRIKTETAVGIHQRSFSYIYDADGMPMSAIVTDTDPPSRMEYKSTITYTYDYL